MPELPEAEVVARQLRIHLLARSSTSVGLDERICSGRVAHASWYHGAVLEAWSDTARASHWGLKRGRTQICRRGAWYDGLLLFRATQTNIRSTCMSACRSRRLESELRYWNLAVSDGFPCSIGQDLTATVIGALGRSLTVPRDEFVRLMQASVDA